MNSLEIETMINQEEEMIKELERKIISLNFKIDDDKKMLSMTKEQEREDKERFYFESLGIKNYNKIRNMWIVFNKKGEFVQVMEFEKNNELEQWLRREKLYAHSLRSFQQRHLEWYDWDLQKKLKNLSWEFNKNGDLKNTDW